MATLLLKLDAPLQAWGTTLKLKDHKTDAYPSKSGVIGMIASALGIRRDDDVKLQELSTLRFGIRIDKPGEIMRDYHVSKIDDRIFRELGYSKNKNNNIYTNNRFYLADAIFTCGVEADKEKLSEIREALLHPANALFLGRRSCPVTADLVGGIVDLDLETALKTTFDDANNTDMEKLRIIVETDDASEKAVRDNPVSFSPENRRYSYRFVKEV